MHLSARTVKRPPVVDLQLVEPEAGRRSRVIQERIVHRTPLTRCPPVAAPPRRASWPSGPQVRTRAGEPSGFGGFPTLPARPEACGQTPAPPVSPAPRRVRAAPALRRAAPQRGFSSGRKALPPPPRSV